ncbi:MAG: hypothetical protein JWO30_3531 [Fibrobacteres bacterium]|nr:hypothetical protein [Fibrobacterota bacterium]
MPGIILLAFFRTEASQANPVFPPAYLRAQFAGSQGLFSLGGGQSFLDGLIEPDFDFGYVPQWAGGESIASVSQTTTISLFPADLGASGTLYRAILGYSGQIALGDHYFLYGKKYVGYYWPSALHFRFFAGAKYFRGSVAIPKTTGWAGCVQIGAIDSDWLAYFANRSIGLGDILTAALALNVYFGSQDPRHASSRARNGSRDVRIP